MKHCDYLWTCVEKSRYLIMWTVVGISRLA